GRVCRLIMLTPSTISRFLSGTIFRTRPRFPRSFPVMTSTVSFFRMGVPSCDISLSPRPPASRSEHFRRQRNDLHEPPLAQLARDRAEHAGADWLALIVDQHGRVPIEPDVGAVLAPLFLDGADDDGLDDLAFLHVSLGRRFLHRGRDDIAKPRVPP